MMSIKEDMNSFMLNYIVNYELLCDDELTIENISTFQNEFNKCKELNEQIKNNYLKLTDDDKKPLSNDAIYQNLSIVIDRLNKREDLYNEKPVLVQKMQVVFNENPDILIKYRSLNKLSKEALLEMTNFNINEFYHIDKYIIITTILSVYNIDFKNIIFEIINKYNSIINIEYIYKNIIPPLHQTN